MSLRERVYSILIVSATDKFTSAFADLLPETRYSPVHTAASVNAAERMPWDISKKMTEDSSSWHLVREKPLPA